MGWVVMSERDLKRVEVLGQVVGGAMTVESAAHVLCLTKRQVFRLLKTYRTAGAGAIRHRARGRPANNRLSDGVRDYAMALIRESYADFGPTLVSEMLAERHDPT